VSRSNSPALGEFGVRAQDVTRFVAKLACSWSTSSTHKAPVENLVLALIHSKFSFDDLGLLPIGISLPLHDVLRCCRESPPDGWPAEAYKLVGRSDLALITNAVKTGRNFIGDVWSDTKSVAFWRRGYALLFSDTTGSAIELKSAGNGAYRRCSNRSEDDGCCFGVRSATSSKYARLVL